MSSKVCSWQFLVLRKYPTCVRNAAEADIRSGRAVALYECSAYIPDMSCEDSERALIVSVRPTTRHACVMASGSFRYPFV